MSKTVFAVLSTLALLTAPAFAQQTTDRGATPQTDQQRAEQLEFRQSSQTQASQRGPAMRASDIDGMEVRNQQNEELGSIDDLVIDLKTGQIRYAALSSGGVLGIGDNLYAIPWSAFRMEIKDDEKYLVLNATSQQFENAPGFNKDKWPNMADPQWQTTNDNYYTEQGISTTRREQSFDSETTIRRNGVPAVGGTQPQESNTQQRSTRQESSTQQRSTSPGNDRQQSPGTGSGAGAGRASGAAAASGSGASVDTPSSDRLQDK